MICFYCNRAVGFQIKTKIRYNGQDYSDPSQLPPKIRAAYEKAMHGPSALHSVRTSRKFVINGQEFADPAQMPADLRTLCEDAMTVMENNGHVTLPGSPPNERLITRRQLQCALLAVGFLVLLALLLAAR
jgi:hypothetical protein